MTNMPLSDFWIVFRWWGTLFLVGAAAYPLTKRLFYTPSGSGLKNPQGQPPSSGWLDGGYLFSKAVGMAVISWIVYAVGTVRVLPFTNTSTVFFLVLLFVGGLLLQARSDKREVTRRTTQNKSFFLSLISFHLSPLLLEELFFFAALLFWSWVKAHEPSIRGLEKFMDFGFMQSILNSRYFPPADMWYAGKSINYYYFGHLVTAVLTKLSGIDLSYTFNLMLATIFALCFTMSFSIGKQLLRGFGVVREIGGGLLTAFLVTLTGNMQTIYAFTRGYTGDNVQPFWQLLWPAKDFFAKLSEGLNTYWYANATRFIPFTIHEFPSYSFVVSDVHGHVLSIPFVLLAIAMLVQIAISNKREASFSLVFYGFLVGILLMTNALDGLIYFALLGAVLVIQNSKFLSKRLKAGKIQNLVIVAIGAGITSLPFLTHFESFVSGLAINCPPAFLANTKVGPFLFESVVKCQHSPIWMMLLLWGFFLYCGIWFLLQKRWYKGRLDNPIEGVLKVFFFFSLVLIIFPEFFYFKDIYPMHFRSNTMFKLGYQAFILFSIVAGYTIVRFLTDKGNRGKMIFFIFLVPQLFLVSIYPIFSVRSYFNSLQNYEGIYGLSWLAREYPDDYAAIRWLNLQPTTYNLQPVLVEADGDSYTDYARVSAFTGIPSIVGWPVHEWLWRGTYDVVAPRREEVRLIYESKDLRETEEILKKYHVRYIFVGSLERKKYTSLNEQKFKNLGKPLFAEGGTEVFETQGTGY